MAETTRGVKAFLYLYLFVCLYVWFWSLFPHLYYFYYSIPLQGQQMAIFFYDVYCVYNFSKEFEKINYNIIRIINFF